MLIILIQIVKFFPFFFIYNKIKKKDKTDKSVREELKLKRLKQLVSHKNNKVSEDTNIVGMNLSKAWALSQKPHIKSKTLVLKYSSLLFLI